MFRTKKPNNDRRNTRGNLQRILPTARVAGRNLVHCSRSRGRFVATTNEQTISLENALREAKKSWLTMKLPTRQPKWHLTFDGHLLRQFKKYGGLADKSDESIEKGHQTLKLLRDRFRGVASFEIRENCIRRELHRTRSPEIQKHIDDYEKNIKQASGTKREVETAERQEQNKKVKLEKRLDCITN